MTSSRIILPHCVRAVNSCVDVSMENNHMNPRKTIETFWDGKKSDGPRPCRLLLVPFARLRKWNLKGNDNLGFMGRFNPRNQGNPRLKFWEGFTQEALNESYGENASFPRAQRLCLSAQRGFSAGGLGNA